MRKKMVLIGAGSSVFTKGLLEDLIYNSGNNKWHLSLVDIDEKVLNCVVKLCQKMIAYKEADIELSWSSDRKDVLSGADYVISTIGVGGRRAWEQDVFIPRKYGVYQPVGDTAMPGGISRAMRMVPAMLDIVQDVKRICPTAKFFNYSNPMAIICRAIRKKTGFPIIGLCHGVNHIEGYLAEVAEVERKKLTTYGVGINHLTFLYYIRYEGKDLKPLLMEKYEQAISKVDREPFCWEIFKRYGAFPAPGDRHITEFFTERFPGGQYYGKTLGIDAYTFEGVIEEGDNTYKRFEEIALSDRPLPEGFVGESDGEHEQLMEIINSIENDERKVFSVNIPNNGLVSNIFSDAVIEINAVAGARGINGIQASDFPDELAAVVNKNLAIIEVAADAALKGSRTLFEEAVLMGGYMTDSEKVSKMVDELMEAQKEYLI